MDKTNLEVLITGAGPTGLMMACQLAMRNVPFRIIDRNEDHTTQSRALAIHARTLEIFEQMRIAREAIQRGKIAKGINLFVNGKRRLRFNLNNIGEGFTQFPFILILEQSKTEKLLNELLNLRGHFVERNTELLDLSQHNQHIEVTLKQKDKEQETIRVDWMIGADGANSLVRKKLDISFSGNTYKESLFVLDCATSLNVPSDEICVSFSQQTFSLFFPMANDRTRVIGIVPEEFQGNDTITFEEATKYFVK